MPRCGRRLSATWHSTEITGRVPVFHPDVRVWEVTDTPSGAHRGLFYRRTFARASGRVRGRQLSRAVRDGRRVHATRLEQQQLPQRVPGALSSRLARRCADAVSQFGHRTTRCWNVRYRNRRHRDFVELPWINKQWAFTASCWIVSSRLPETERSRRHSNWAGAGESVEETFSQGCRDGGSCLGGHCSIADCTPEHATGEWSSRRPSSARFSIASARPRSCPPSWSAALRPSVWRRRLLRALPQLFVGRRRWRRTRTAERSRRTVRPTPLSHTASAHICRTGTPSTGWKRISCSGDATRRVGRCWQERGTGGSRGAGFQIEDFRLKIWGTVRPDSTFATPRVRLRVRDLRLSDVRLERA